MRSFIIISKNEDLALEKIKQICFENNIDKLDITIESFEKAIGIEDVRKLQKYLYLKPLRGENKALVVNAFRGITTESQNALLKILEEPPLSSFIFLLVENINILLPTIISRCRVIELENEIDRAKINIEEINNLIQDLSSENTGRKLKLAQDFGKSREETVAWLEQVIFGIRQVMLQRIDNSGKLIDILKKLEEGYYAAKNTNVNQRFILENTFLSI